MLFKRLHQRPAPSVDGSKEVEWEIKKKKLKKKYKTDMEMQLDLK